MVDLSPPPLALALDVYGEGADEERSILGPLGVEVAQVAAHPEAATEQLQRAIALMVVDTRVDDALLRKAPRCRIVATYGVGVDNIDLVAAESLGIAVANVPDYCTSEVADHAIALWLAVERRVVAGNRVVRSGSWGTSDLTQPRRLAGLTFGLMGLGRIARAVAERVRAFGCVPIAYDPYVPLVGDDIERVGSVTELAHRVDVLSLHMPLTDETRNVVNEDVFAVMRSEAVLINTARGALIDERALELALRMGSISGAGIDVFANEPPDLSLLQGFDQVVLTPHIGFWSREARLTAQRGVATAVAAAFEGERIPNRLV